ncbi:ABC-type transport system involved in multi-copper enzyme maturation permease subunit [Kribbella amoyensis]|uniref:ABC-type transport system involved in multi-copper enzyme maturation permease subunit n=1 Tax=Kribbella amoyensis TaxID=996641 RepID=A0A561BK09_9ACTN|nr:ABC transporter permease [Kribbella amoyensis]TWD79200.1 ABC-type transport system involved in multi-copper enzyme maturation permease subunit [Kribbella amoyensis]
MIWLTWRQFRVPALAVAGAVAVLAVFCAVTGPGLASDYRTTTTGFLDLVAEQRLNRTLYLVGQFVVYAAPPVIGAFWGAPLIARELEAGTHRLVWSQSISRSRWLTVKVGLTGAAAISVSGLLSLIVTWWAGPIDDSVAAGNSSNVFELARMQPPLFGARGVVPIGYAAFAFAVGVTLGLVIRRSIVAIALTLAVVVAFQALAPSLIRPHLMSPVVETKTLTKDTIRGLMLSGPEKDPEVLRVEVLAGAPGLWKVSDETVKDGVVQKTLPSYLQDCGPRPPEARERKLSPDQCFQRFEAEGYRQQVKYYPADRFWGLQWRETGLFLLLAFGLTGFCFWRIRRDLT